MNENNYPARILYLAISLAITLGVLVMLEYWEMMGMHPIFTNIRIGLILILLLISAILVILQPSWRFKIIQISIALLSMTIGFLLIPTHSMNGVRSYYGTK